jgi:hypothetical protein
MKTRLLSLLLAAFLAGELTSPVFGQSRTPPPVEPQADFDDFDDRPFTRYPPHNPALRDEEHLNLVWLWVLLGLSLLGGGGWYFSDFFEE